MTNSKQTNKALLSSVIALILCLSMLIGTTFAWFTDGVESGVNEIKAGNLDVELYYGKGEPKAKVENTTTDLFTDANGEAILWEPGAVAYTNLKVANEGTLALKYQLSINFENETKVNGHGLSEALWVAVVENGFTGDRVDAKAIDADAWEPLANFTLPGALEAGKTQTYGIVIYWLPVDNDFDNLFNMNNELKDNTLSINLGVKLIATQKDVEAEQDSFGDDYDEDAWMPEMQVHNAQDLQAAINAGEKNIVLMDDVVITDGPIVIPAPATTTYSLRSNAVVIDLNGKKISTVDGNVIRNEGSPLVLMNGTIERTGNAGGYAINNIAGALTVEKMTVKGGVFTNGDKLTITDSHVSQYLSSKHAVYAYNCEVTIDGGTFHNDNSGNATIMIAGNSVATIEDGTFSIKDGRVDGPWTSCMLDANGSAAYVINGGDFDGGFRVQSNAKMTINGGSFKNTVGGDYAIYGSATVNGGSFEGDKTEKFATDNMAPGFELEEDENGKPVVSPAIKNGADLQEAIKNAQNGDVITLVQDITVGSEVVDENGTGNAFYYTGDKSFTIDLNGYTVSVNTSNAGFRFQKADGVENTITIKNGKIVAGANTWSAISIGSSASTKTNVNLIGLEISSCKANDLAVRARSGSEFTITDCVINATNGAGGVVAGGGNITLNNVTINQSGWYSNNWNCVALGISGNGKITVNSGSYTSDPEGNEKGTWVAYIMSSGGTLEINGGTFNGTVGETASAAYARGLICADRAAVVKINGGTFNSNGAILDMRNNVGTQPNPVATLAGGIFSSDPRISGLYSSNLIHVENGFEVVENADGTYAVEKVKVVEVNGTKYASLEEAAANAKAGDTIKILGDVTLVETVTLPADVVLNGNGKQIDGTIWAGGNLTIEGHTKVANFSATYYDRIITIGEGACLEITGTGRVTLGYGNTFNITGSINDAKNTDKNNVQPSLIIPGGISITGGNNATMNVENAYVKIGNTSSKNSGANGKFVLNFNNSIAEFTNQLTFSEPTNGNNPSFELNIKDSVLTTAAKLCVAAPNSTVNVDNSVVELGSNLRNSGKLLLKNGSVLTGATIQFGENGGNNGTIIVDNSTLEIVASSTGHAFDGKNEGEIVVQNGGKATVDYYKDMNIVVADESSSFSGTQVN